MVTKAVIPAAGFGTRMLPITKSIPKEMLPIGRKPMIQHAVEEVVASGISRIAIVIREGKEVIEDYFVKPNPGGDNMLSDLERLYKDCRPSFLYQEKPLGLGDALRCARDFVGDDPFVMVIPDQLSQSSIPATKQLIEKYDPSTMDVLHSMVKIPKDEDSFFPGAQGFTTEPVPEGDYRVTGLLNEEALVDMYENYDYTVRGWGRTIYSAAVFDFLTEEYLNPATGEVDLSRSLPAILKHLKNRAIVLEDQAYDFGTWDGYLYFTKNWHNKD